MRGFVARASLAACCALAACGGGGSGVVPAAPSANANSVAATRATMRLTIPARTQRGAQYVSASTQSVVLTEGATTLGTFDTTPTSSGCSAIDSATVCQFTFTSTLGSQTIGVKAYDGPNGTGTLLASGSVTQTLVAGSNVIPVVLSGVVSELIATVATTDAGTAASVPVAVTAKDPDGNAIIAPGNYPSPITLSDGDTSGATSLSVNGGVPSSSVRIASPNDVVTLHYSGANLASAMLTPSAAGVSVTTAGTFAPTPTELPSYQLPDNHGGTDGLAPVFIANGGDGNVWVYATGTSAPREAMFRVSVGGAFTEYDPGIAPSTNLQAQTVTGLAGTPVGSAIAVWGTYGTAVAVGAPVLFSMSSSGVVVNDDAPSGWCSGGTGFASAIVADGAGGAWFTVQCGGAAGDQIAHVSSNGTIALSAQDALRTSNSIVLGHDGNVYVAGVDRTSGHAAVEQGIVSGNAIGTVNELLDLSADGNTSWNGIAQSADGDLWLTNDSCNPSLVARVHFAAGAFGSGTLSVFPTSQGCAYAGLPLALSDDSVWLPNGNFPTVTELVPHAETMPTQTNVALSSPSAIYGAYYQGILGPDGHLWFAEEYASNAAPYQNGVLSRFAY